jgi:hypothetical protein
VVVRSGCEATLAQKGQLPDALPGDVYDLAWLPSHVHQLACVLEAQLVVL